MSWADRAACLGLDPDWFFPTLGRPGFRGQDRYLQPLIDRAVAVCQTCPVVFECGEAAHKDGAIHGVWGGRSVAGIKHCPDCDLDLPSTFFTVGQPGAGGSRTYCRECHNNRTRSYREAT